MLSICDSVDEAEGGITASLKDSSMVAVAVKASVSEIPCSWPSNPVTGPSEAGECSDDDSDIRAISCFFCDAPARAYVKNIKLHSGYQSCEQGGEYIDGNMENLGVGLITGMVLDSMHLVYLVVVRQILNCWKTGKGVQEQKSDKNIFSASGCDIWKASKFASSHSQRIRQKAKVFCSN